MRDGDLDLLLYRCQRADPALTLQSTCIVVVGTSAAQTIDPGANAIVETVDARLGCKVEIVMGDRFGKFAGTGRICKSAARCNRGQGERCAKAIRAGYCVRIWCLLGR